MIDPQKTLNLVRQVGVYSVQDIEDSNGVQDIDDTKGVQDIDDSKGVQDIDDSNVIQDNRDSGVVQDIHDSKDVQDIHDSKDVQEKISYDPRGVSDLELNLSEDRHMFQQNLDHLMSIQCRNVLGCVSGLRVGISAGQSVQNRRSKNTIQSVDRIIASSITSFVMVVWGEGAAPNYRNENNTKIQANRACKCKKEIS